MDEYIYYWPLLEKYCYKSELEDFVEEHGHNYSIHTADKFFTEIWIDKEDEE